METVVDKFKDHWLPVIGLKETHKRTDWVGEAKGFRKDMTLRWWPEGYEGLRKEKVREEKRELVSLEEGMAVEQWRISAEEDHVQRSFTDKGAKHMSGPEKVSKMAAQSVWNVQNRVWKKKLGPHQGPCQLPYGYEYIMRTTENHWVMFYRRITWAESRFVLFIAHPNLHATFVYFSTSKHRIWS